MIEADIILKCTGLRPNISLTTKTFGMIKVYLLVLRYIKTFMHIMKWILLRIEQIYFLAPDVFEDDEGRRLKVDDMLLIKGQTNVYAIGDCCNTKV